MQEPKETWVRSLGWRSPGGGHDNPLQYSCLENPMDRGTWQATVHASWLLLLLLSHFSRVWLCDPIDSSPPGSPVPGILQARTLEWVAISFSNAWKWKVNVKSLSRGRPSATPWTAAFQAPLSMGFSRQEYWSEVSLPSPMQHGTLSLLCTSPHEILTIALWDRCYYYHNSSIL